MTPTDPAISTTSTVMSTGSAPIATSTPVNFAAGPVSPPPLTLAAGPGPPHQEQPLLATSAAKVTSYPAVLKGRTAASPPIPNLVPSGKIPPPVPPRGPSRTARSSEEHRGPATATSTSSMASSRGDEAAIITRYRLHESSSILHHLPTPDYISTSTVSAASAVTTTTTTTNYSVAATCTTTSSLLFSAGTTTNTITTTTTTAATVDNTANCHPDSNNAIDTTATCISNTTTTTTAAAVVVDTDTMMLHARTSTPAYLPPRYENLAFYERTRDLVAAAFESIHEERTATPRATTTRWNNDRWPVEDLYQEEEEFVSVEKVDGSYVIRTSPYPFRPERGNFMRTEMNASANRVAPVASEEEEERRATSSRAEHMAKFTYFLNPASRPELMNYKMSRKDKKHSETYYERMKRKQRELEASIATITTITQRSKVEERTVAPRSIATISKQQEKLPEKRIEIQRLMERRRDSKLLRKIREKSAQRKKKLAPEPSPPGAQAFFRTNDKNFEDLERKTVTEPRSRGTTASLNPGYGNSERDVKTLESKRQQIVHKSDKRSFLVTKVDEEVPIKLKSIQTVYSSEQLRKRDDAKVDKKFMVSNKVKVDGASDQIGNPVSGIEQLTKNKNERVNVLESPINSDESKGVLIPNSSFLHGYERSPKRRL